MFAARRFGALAAVLSLVLTGCGGSKPKAGSPTPATRPSSTATVSIVAPANGGTVTGGTIRVQIALKGGKITSVTSQNLSPDEGHLHLSLDSKLISMTGGLSTEIPNVTPGTHLIEVEFVASDHSPFNPRVFAGNTFIVR